MKINDIEIKLIDGDLQNGTKNQTAIYKLLSLLITLEVESCSSEFIQKYLGLSSALPIWSRLEHLEQMGKIKMSREAITA